MICHVYIMECQSPGFKPLKIGIAVNPRKRIEELQTGCPWDIKLKMVIPMPSRKAASNLESFLHRKFRKSNMNGEWFHPKKVNIKLALEHYERIEMSVTKTDVNHENVFGSRRKTKNVNDRIDEKLDREIDLSWI